MRNLTKIFVAVAALFVGFACTTDVTDDLGVQTGNGAGQTTVTLSLEESRTALGAEVNHLYPVTWSADDAISINGVKSSSIAVSSNAAVATFTFNASLSYPYCVAYPAATEGKVVFADQQSYAEGTFANGAAVMYGYAESTGALSLKHLTGVLKIGVTGDKTLAYAQISTADRAPIAGEFAVDYAKGEVEATAASKEFVNYSFGAGLALSATPQYLHIAVPAGVYHELYVTLYDTEGGVMYATVKANDEKPLTAGKVRAFSNPIAYSATESVYVIRDKASLKAFAAEAATLEKNVLFVADVDMTGEEWTPIEGYKKNVLGNGCAVKGLNAPLFGTINGSIKGLHLQDVTLVTNDAPIVGALACHVAATDEVSPVVEHCSVSGTLTVDNKTLTSETAQNYQILLYGGLVGWAQGVTFDHCVNNVAINVVQTMDPATATDQLLHLGGIVARMGIYTNTQSNEVVYSSILNATNNGAIYVNDEVQPAGKGLVTPHYAGIVGLADDANKAPAKFENCVNNAPITVKNLNAYTPKTAMVAGIIGYGTGMDMINCENTKNAKITIDGGGTDLYVAGLSSYMYYSKHENLTNSADIVIENADFSSNIIVGGVLGSPSISDSNGAHFFTGENLVNNGAVIVKNTSAATTRIGGLIGRSSQGDVSNSVNNGEVYYLPNSGDKSTNISMGGFSAEGNGDSDAGTILRCVNNGNVTLDITGSNKITVTRLAALSGYCHHLIDGCTNYCTLLVTGSGTFTTNNSLVDATTDSHYNYGSMAGYKAAATGGIRNSVNYGDVIFEATIASASGVSPAIQVGGLAGRTHQPITANSNNYGRVIVRGDTSTSSTATLCIGGTVGLTQGETKDGHANAGNIYVSGKHNKMYLGGCAGLNSTNKNSDGKFTSLALIKNATNSGHIFVGFDYNATTKKEEVVATTFTDCPIIGGVIGNSDKYSTDLTNSGNIRMNANVAIASASISTYIGGCVGLAYTANLGGVCKNLSNSGDISFEGGSYTTGDVALNIGGCVGYQYGNSHTNDSFYNSGNITYNTTTTSAGALRMGGVGAYLQCTATNLTNDGKISLIGKTGTSAYIGGIVCQPNGYDRPGLVNNGDIYVDATIAKDCFIGGLCYELKSGNKKLWRDCVNNGDITVTKNSLIKGNLAIGGIIAKASTTGENKIFQNCVNNGSITDNSKTTGTHSLGGLIGYLSNGVGLIVKDSFINNGTITYAGTTDGADGIYVGGVLGYGYTFSYDTTTWTGNVINNGNIIASGTSIGGQYNVAGIMASAVGSLGENVNLYSFGDITVTGGGTEKNGTEGIESIGGIFGKNPSYAIYNANVFCNIKAIGANYVGMVQGYARTADACAFNSNIGGTICKEVKFNGDTFQDEEFVVTIDESNFMDYIYGTTTDWTGVTNYDGCSFLTVKPEVPTTPAQ